jgi:hypothetical protein
MKRRGKDEALGVVYRLEVQAATSPDADTGELHQSPIENELYAKK